MTLVRPALAMSGTGGMLRCSVWFQTVPRSAFSMTQYREDSMSNGRFASWTVFGVALICLVAFTWGCRGESESGTEASTGDQLPAGTGSARPAGTTTDDSGSNTLDNSGFSIPEFDTSGLSVPMQMKLGSAQRAARQAPDDLVKLSKLGSLHYVHGDPQIAALCFARTTELAPDQPVGWYCMGLARERAGDRSAAIEAYKKVLALDARNGAAHRRIASLLEQQGEMAEAERHAQLAAAVPAGDPLLGVILREGMDLDALLAMANELARAKDFAGAIAAVESASEVDIEGVKSREVMARLLAMQGRLSEAARELQELLAEHPERIEARISLAGLAIQAQQYAAARLHVEDVLKRDPGNLAARYQLGVLLLREGDTAGAKREWMAILDEQPQHLEPRFGLLGLLVQQNDIAGVEQLLREGVEHRPDSAVLVTSLAWLLATSADESRRSPEEAVRWGQQACELTGHADHAALDTLAAAYASAGLFDDACKQIAEAIRLARAAGATDLAAGYEERQALYKAGQPYVQHR